MSREEVLRAGTESLSLEEFRDTQVLRAQSLPVPLEVLQSMTPEQWAFAHKVSTAMLEKLAAADLREVDINIVVGFAGLLDHEMQATVMDTAPRGLVGRDSSLVALLSEQSTPAFMIEVDGQQIDTRKGMTWQVYKDFIGMELALGRKPLPDSIELGEVLHQASYRPDLGTAASHWPSTWLSGEADALERSRCARVILRRGYPEQPWNFAENHHGTYFRPAVRIPGVALREELPAA